MKWKTEVQVIGEEGKWHGNGKEFGAVKDAIAYAKDLCARWTQTICWRVVSVESVARYGGSFVSVERKA